jgi:CheY-like chemotaxis protein
VKDQSHTPPLETILFVEDEPLIRMDMVEFLRQCGYTVAEATDAKGAMEALKSKLTFNLVISDIRMPGEMDGRALARWVRENHPSVQVILTSAYSRSREHVAVENVSYLAKPYTGQVLLARIRKMLGQPAQ